MVQSHWGALECDIGWARGFREDAAGDHDTKAPDSIVEEKACQIADACREHHCSQCSEPRHAFKKN